MDKASLLQFIQQVLPLNPARAAVVAEKFHRHVAVQNNSFPDKHL
jgi:hypothetical protein